MKQKNDTNLGGWNLLGVSKHIRELRKEIAEAAEKPFTVLVQGPSGTGKELIARDIHDHSPRKNSPFVIVNCAAIVKDLFESELFGHEKGAFTGALKEKKGLVEVADGGTLFLDEVGDLRADHQVKLLRFLQDKTYRPVGGEKERKVDVRVVAATNKDLMAEVNNNNFREDLYYRLAQSRIKTTSLKDRPEDIVYLLNWFSMKKEFEVDVKKKLLLYSYTFPGNVRQLKTFLHRNLNQLIDELKEDWVRWGIHPNHFITNPSYRGFRILLSQAKESNDFQYVQVGADDFEVASCRTWVEKLFNDRNAYDCLEAIFLMGENNDIFNKIIEAYEITTLLLSHMPSSAIAKLLKIRKEKVSPNSFMTYYNLNWPKGTDLFKNYYTMKVQHFPLFQSLLAKLRK
jgi:transcriptional regulator with PAS, ATPase and Fis domain